MGRSSKNPAQIRREVLSKLFKDVVQTSLPIKQLCVKKANGTLLIDRRRVVTLRVVSEESHHLDCDQVLCNAKFSSLKLKSISNVHWLTECGQVPNTNIVPMCLGFEQLSFLFWNGRGICMANTKTRSSMGSHIKRLGKVGHGLCFQERHGLEGDYFSQFSSCLPG